MLTKAPTKRRVPTPAPELPEVREATPDELMEILDRRARMGLGISGDEFLHRWFGGQYAGDVDRPGVIECAMLVPFIEDYWQAHRQPLQL